MTNVAIVTGGAGSIGGAAAERLVRDGYAVIVADTAPPANAIAGTHFVEVDVRSTSSVAALLDAAEAHGTLAAVVLAHGVLRVTPVGTFEPDAVDAVLDVNLRGVALVANLASARIADRGALVFVSSVTASMGRASGAWAYLATKGGVESLTRGFAVALGAREVRVNCVAPGFVSVPMQGEGVTSRANQGTDALLAFTPFKRLVTPAEVADAIGFLCSPQASGITGAVLPVDGGQRAY